MFVESYEKKVGKAYYILHVEAQRTEKSSMCIHKACKRPEYDKIVP
jgi:hypothetical protein